MQELVVSTPNQRNWRGILIALLVIVAVLGLIICSILLLSPPDEGPRVKGEHFTLDAIAEGQFVPKTFNGSWISEIELIYRDYYGGVKIFCAENYTTRSLMSNVTFRQINAVDYKVSPDLNYVLLMTDVIKIWMHSFKARYYIYEVATQEHFPLWVTEDGSESEQLPYLESVSWTPTGSGLVFIYKNNLYYKPSIRRPQTYTLTRDGVEDVIFNGRPDFLYETKILETGTALWFSPDAALLAYATFNCSEVGNMQFPYYGNSIYEEIHSVRFPKAGTPNTKVRLTIANMSFPKILKTSVVQPPVAYAKSDDFYMTGVQWINSTELAVTWMNRRQTMTSVSLCRQPDWICVDIHQDKLADDWVSKIPNPVFDKNGTWFLAILPFQDGDQGRFQELCQVDSTSRKYMFLTSPPMTVLEILAWDLENHFVYFIATLEPGNRHLFKTGDRNSSQRQWDCLTCCYENGTVVTGSKFSNLANRTTTEKASGNYRSFTVNVSLDDGDRSPRCLFAKVYFNSLYNPRYYVLDCLGPEVPSTVLVDAVSNQVLTVLNANTELRNLFYSMAIPQIKTFEVELESGYHAQVRLYLPPGLREYEPMVFPLILHVDSTPGSQLVNEKFQVNWWWYLAGHRNFIVAEIDARGTGFQGDKLVREINGKIGVAEVEDQIAVMFYLRDTLKFVDKHRMGVFGEGHGGYVAATILMQDRDLFRCGVSVNPITSFLLTDSFTTERYLGMPNRTESYRAYDEADLNKKVASLNENGKQFLLVSSTADIEFPVQHSMNLIRALIKENAIFKHQIYPDVGHDLSPVSGHYYKLLDSFWDECFAPLDLQDWETMASFIPFRKE
ncbi:UNVERIFIED_CONTAM: hypothetical protein PYX00_004935 [Menopon gallinae]|uniref:Uncharacterized protein n=2 Tax=Menopon gallinae TaxID=328185 RepID=A0AAW2I5V4_9NEOP